MKIDHGVSTETPKCALPANKSLVMFPSSGEDLHGGLGACPQYCTHQRPRFPSEAQAPLPNQTRGPRRESPFTRGDYITPLTAPKTTA